MKKVYWVVIIALCSLFFVACGKPANSLEGKFYKVYEGEKTLAFEFDKDSGFYHLSSMGGAVPITNIERDKKQFAVSGFLTVVIAYNISDTGELEILNGGGMEGTYYKEDSKALEEAMK